MVWRMPWMADCGQAGYSLSRRITMAGLAEKTCVPCRGGVPPLTGEQIKPLAAKVEDWQVINNHYIEKEFSFPDFKTALAFTTRIAEVAEVQGHQRHIVLASG